MRLLFFLALILFALVPNTGRGQGVALLADHSVAVKDLAEVSGEHSTLPDPRFIPLPAYPPELLRAWVSGDAVIRFHVNEDGIVSEVTVVSASVDLFGKASITAVSQWKFGHPKNRGTGKPSGLWASCHLVFQIG
jgi:TonB family protein